MRELFVMEMAERELTQEKEHQIYAMHVDFPLVDKSTALIRFVDV